MNCRHTFNRSVNMARYVPEWYAIVGEKQRMKELLTLYVR